CGPSLTDSSCTTAQVRYSTPRVSGPGTIGAAPRATHRQRDGARRIISLCGRWSTSVVELGFPLLQEGRARLCCVWVLSRPDMPNRLSVDGLRKRQMGAVEILLHQRHRGAGFGG